MHSGWYPGWKCLRKSRRSTSCCCCLSRVAGTALGAPPTVASASVDLLADAVGSVIGPPPRALYSPHGSPSAAAAGRLVSPYNVVSSRTPSPVSAGGAASYAPLRSPYRETTGFTPSTRPSRRVRPGVVWCLIDPQKERRALASVSFIFFFFFACTVDRQSLFQQQASRGGDAGDAGDLSGSWSSLSTAQQEYYGA